ncbi:Homeodomain-interacting protein kinase 3 [Dissophora ornata]|nr:Homeodomain-interacting protein kinase 3 [Dissophora ornata]
MDTHPRRQEQGQNHGQAQGQGPRLKLDELGPQQHQHTPRYRHVSAPVQQPQNLSSFQEGMRQDSVVVNAAPAVSATGRTVDGSDYDQSRLNPDSGGRISSNQTTLRPQEPGQQSDRSTCHVGITIDDHQSHDGSLAQEDHILAYEQEHLPSGSPSSILAEPLPPSATSHSSRSSLSSGVFQPGYSPYSQLPGTTLSRHLSIQLSPSTTLLPPSQPALHLTSQAPYSMEGSLRDQSLSREYVMRAPPLSSKTASSQHAGPLSTQLPSQQGHLQQHAYQQVQQLPPQLQPHQWQPQSPSQQTVAVPPPPIKYIRSPLRSPKMPQLSSQAMAHAQAQAQVQSSSQYRHHHHHHHHSSNQHASPTIQSQQQFPPRTHRRSIQPLTLEQQQPKGGSFRYVRNQADLWPQKGSQKYRSIDALGHSISPLRALTDLLTKTYSHCNRDFKYEPSYNPRRVLTKPSKPVHNEGYDNEDYDYILYVSDILGSEERQRYLILDVLGQGTFGQVVKCQNLKTNAIVAVKVIKNKPAYFNQSMMEVTVLELLNERYDMDDRHHILRLQDTFIHRRHLCLVFELLSVNLYELIKQNQFRGLSMSLVRVFTAQLLDALCVLSEARIIHCDLKPENVLLKNLETPTIKVIDFGSACHEQQTVYTYIQSRFYRSPEVLVGLP